MEKTKAYLVIEYQNILMYMRGANIETINLQTMEYETEERIFVTFAKAARIPYKNPKDQRMYCVIGEDNNPLGSYFNEFTENNGIINITEDYLKVRKDKKSKTLPVKLLKDMTKEDLKKIDTLNGTSNMAADRVLITKVPKLVRRPQ